MKFLLLAPFIALAAAQNLDLLNDLPNCGTSTCLMPAFNSSGCDYITNIDIACICSSSAVRNALTCVKKECSDSDTDQYFNFANLACIGREGYPIDQDKAETKAEDKPKAGDEGAASGLAVNLGLVVAAAALVGVSGW